MRVTQPLTDEAINANARARYFKTAGVPVSGCTRTSPRCPDAREYSVDLRECCKGHLRQIVRDVAAVLNELGHVWWADYGTLLGAVRNAGIIPHDKDVDLGMLWPKRGMTALREIEARLKKQGYDISIRRGGDNLKVRLSSTNLTNADLFMWHERADGTMHRTRYVMGVDRYKGRDFRKEDAFPLATVEWEGMTLPAPKNPAAFCAFRYGPTWQTPIRRNHDGVVRGESR